MRCLTLAFCLLAHATFAQSPEIQNHWFFGQAAGLDFNRPNNWPGSQPAQVHNAGAVATNEGCATISDPDGNLLFYTDGQTVYNRLHLPMNNGNGLAGSSNAAQSAIIVPRPGSTEVFYVFTVAAEAGAAGLSYSVVNLSHSGGLGTVVIKNQVLLTPATEKLIAVPASDQWNIWIIGHEWNSANYCAFLLTDGGLVTAPVVSQGGVVASGSLTRASGCMVATEQGDHIASAFFDMDAVEVLDFDGLSGTLTPAHLLTNYSMGNPYGVAFDPFGQFLYVSERTDLGTIWQYDLYLSGTPAIDSARVSVTDIQRTRGALQLGPDQRLYVAEPGRSWVARIDLPGFPDTLCGYNANAVWLNQGICALGLPQKVIVSVLLAAGGCGQLVVCAGEPVYFACSNQLVDSLVWQFDDPASGYFNWSWLSSTMHVYETAGTYHPSLSVSYWGWADVLHFNIVVLPRPELEIASDTMLCPGSGMTLTTNYPDLGHRWSTGDTLTSIYGMAGQTYICDVVDSNGCFGSDKVTLAVIELPPALGGDRNICEGDTIVLESGLLAGPYVWQDGSSQPHFEATGPGTYAVSANYLGCPIYETVELRLQLMHDVELVGDTAFCAGTMNALKAVSDSGAISWSTGESSASIMVADSGQYWVAVTIDACTNGDTIDLSWLPLPHVDLGADTTLCERTKLRANDALQSARFRWQNGTTDSTCRVVFSGWYWLEATENGCTATDSVYVTVDPLPAMSIEGDTSVCPGQPGWIIVDAMHTEHLVWNDSSQVYGYRVVRGGEYMVEARNRCGSLRDTVVVDDGQCACHVYVPNAFTPNADGLNDRFGPQFECDVVEMDFHVFNRWGELVFTGRNPDQWWDGTAWGTLAKTDVYTWSLTYAKRTGKEIEREYERGTVALLR